MELFNILVGVGITATLGAFIYIGRKLQILEDLKDTTGKIKMNVKVIGDYLTSASADFDHTELQSYSPLKLTDKGEKLIKEIGFDNVFEKHKDDFCTSIENENPKLKYDVEKAAIKAISALYNEEYMGFLKVYFYNNPARNLKNVSPTLGVYLRDKYLEQHPEITE